MESHGEAGRVHCRYRSTALSPALITALCGSAATAALLAPHSFQLEQRGRLEVKGKGAMETYWLAGADWKEPRPTLTRPRTSTRRSFQATNITKAFIAKYVMAGRISHED